MLLTAVDEGDTAAEPQSPRTSEGLASSGAAAAAALLEALAAAASVASCW